MHCVRNECSPQHHDQKCYSSSTDFILAIHAACNCPSIKTEGNTKCREPTVQKPIPNTERKRILRIWPEYKAIINPHVPLNSTPGIHKCEFQKHSTSNRCQTEEYFVQRHTPHRNGQGLQ